MPSAESISRPPSSDAARVLDFWFGDGLVLGWPSQSRKELWFGGGAALDADVTQRFGEQVEAALRGGLADWETAALDRLALVILLDQFTRSVFRGQARAFSGDPRAQQLVRDALALGWDRQLPPAGRVFLYMPLMHAEDMALQDDCVRRFGQLVAQSGPRHGESLSGHLAAAEEHRAIIARFGRFPYRNRVLGRTDTEAERDFLARGPRFGQ